MKKGILFIIMIVVFGVLCLYILTTVKDYTGTGFKRRLIDPGLKLIKTFKFKDHSFGFAWEPSEEIWLKNFKDPLTFFRIDYSLNKLKNIKIEMPVTFSIKSRNINFDRSSSNIYVTNELGQIAKLSKDKTSILRVDNINFDEPNIISDKSIIVRSFKHTKEQRGLELTKLILQNEPEVNIKYLLPKQVDGIFCADGSLHYDRVQSRLFYMYYHRGEFLCLDTNLNLLYKAKTIDTVRMARIKLGTYNSKLKDGTVVKKQTQIQPQNLVNRYLTINKDRIYILSGLKADNETSDAFSRNQPIDVYALKDGKYLYSFYLPRFNRFKLRQFAIKGTLIIAIYENYLVTFNFNGMKK